MEEDQDSEDDSDSEDDPDSEDDQDSEDDLSQSEEFWFFFLVVCNFSLNKVLILVRHLINPTAHLCNGVYSGEEWVRVAFVGRFSSESLFRFCGFLLAFVFGSVHAVKEKTL
ncbi:hypothetical protein ACFX2J_045185 [Malus domestica]